MYLQTNYITLISLSFFQKSLHKFVIRFISAFFDSVQMQRLKLVLHSLLLLFIASALKSHIYFQNQIDACKIIPPANPIPKWRYVIFKWRVFFVNYRPYKGILRRLQAIIETFTPVFQLKKSKFFFSNLGYILLDPFYGKQIFKIHAQGDLDCRFETHFMVRIFLRLFSLQFRQILFCKDSTTGNKPNKKQGFNSLIITSSVVMADWNLQRSTLLFFRVLLSPT